MAKGHDLTGKLVSGSTEGQFASVAVGAFERTYRALFEQAHIEVDRLEKVNRAMAEVEESLLDPERIKEMDIGQQLALADMLNRTSNGAIKNLMGFSTVFLQVRSVVGLLDGIKRHTDESSILPGPRKSPALPNRTTRNPSK